MFRCGQICACCDAGLTHQFWCPETLRESCGLRNIEMQGSADVWGDCHLQCKPCESLVARIEASSHTFVLPVLKIWQPLAKCGHGCSGLTRRLLCAVYWVWAVISELLAQAVVHIARKEGHKSRDHIG